MPNHLRFACCILDASVVYPDDDNFILICEEEE